MGPKGKNHDLTEGSIWKKIVLFSLPVMVGSLFQQLYTTVDAVVVGQFAGKEALAAIDAISSMTRLPVNFFVGLATGATILISQLFGAKKQGELSDAVHTSVAFSLAGGLVLSVLGFLVAPAALRLLLVPAEIYDQALVYARIYFAGFVASMVYNIGAGILRAVGNSRTPFIVLVIATLVNVGLDLLFVAVFRWDVGGAALATVISQAVSAVLVIMALVRSTLACRLELRRVRFVGPVMKRIFRLGLPIGLQASMYPLANMLIQSSVNQFGTDTIAAFAIVGKMDLLVWLVADSLGATIATFTAQNYGARQMLRARKGVAVGIGLSALLISAIAAALYFGSGALGRLFVDDDAVIALGAQVVRMLAPMYWFYIPGEILSGAIRGTGETFRPMLITLLCTCAFRLFCMVLKHGLSL